MHARAQYVLHTDTHTHTHLNVSESDRRQQQKITWMLVSILDVIHCKVTAFEFPKTTMMAKIKTYIILHLYSRVYVLISKMICFNWHEIADEFVSQCLYFFLYFPLGYSIVCIQSQWWQWRRYGYISVVIIRISPSSHVRHAAFSSIFINHNFTYT